MNQDSPETFDDFVKENTLPAEVAKPEPRAMKPATPLMANEGGLLVGSTFEEQFRLARAYAASGLMPASLSTPEKVLVALQLCHELGLPPMSSIGKIAVINGTASLFGDLPLALVQKSGLLEEINEEIEMEGNDPVKATCMVKRKGASTPVVRTFTMEDAKRAKLWGTRVWGTYPKRMMQMRARSHALKDAFADVLLGISIAEYDVNVIPEAGEEIKTDRASGLNERFAKKTPINITPDNEEKK